MKQFTKWMRAAALLLCLVLALSACGTDFGGGLQDLLGGGNYQPNAQDDDRRTIPYSQIEYTRPDTEAIKARLAELTTLVTEANNFKKVMEYDGEMGDMMTEFSTMSSLAYLKSYQYTDDPYWEEEYRFCADAEVEISLAANEFNRAIVEGEYAEDYRQEVGDYIFTSIQNDLLLSSPTVEEFKKERAQLNIDYNRYISDLTISLNGKELTMADIDELYYSGNSQDYWVAFRQYGQEHADTYTECYRRMIELDKLTAQELGFGSAAEMYYISYSRDYTPHDTESLFSDVKELFVPLLDAVYSQYIPSTSISMSNTFNAMPEALANISPELVQAWDHMLLNEMYDFEARSNKQAGGAFCIDLPAYDTGFIYGYWNDDFSYATTVMHEFGHYYDSWLHYEGSTVFNLDIAECYSQGLEVLLQEYYGDFTRNPANARAENLQGFMNPLTYQVILEDFQQQLYALDTFDTGVISQLYAKTLRDYGYSPFTDSKGNDYSWLQIPHLFDAPFYTISYFTSACAALQIWEVAQTDWREAADIYLTLIHEDQNQPFVQLLQNAGLNSPFDETTLRDVAYAMADAFDAARPSAA